MNTVENLLDAIDRQIQITHARGRQAEGGLIVVNSAAMDVLGSTEILTEHGTVYIGIDDTIPDGEAMFAKYARPRI